MKEAESTFDCNKFFEAKTRKDISDLLEIEEKSLRYFLFKRRTENMYTTFKVLKKNGECRKISAPHEELKQIQRKLAYVLSQIYSPKICAYGFINDKNILGNALRHVRKKLVINIDLKDFFTQIHFGRVRGMFMNSPYSLGEEAATTIAQIACLSGVLPQGSPSSPILTNMICVPLDNHLMRLAQKTGCVYTRYADDITFSTYKKEFPSSIAYREGNRVCIGDDLLSILKKQSFEANPKKTTIKSYNERQEVTGLTVNLFPNIRRSYLKHVRAILHHCEKNGIYKTAQEYVSKGYCKNSDIIQIINTVEKQAVIEDWFKKVLLGKVNYIRQIKGEKNLTFLSFAKRVNDVLDSDFYDISELNKLSTIASNYVFLLKYELEEDYIQGSGFYLKDYGLLTSYHLTESGNFFQVYRIYPDKKDLINCISKETNEKYSEKETDYALYNMQLEEGSSPLTIGDSLKINIGDTVIIIGYPDYKDGDSPYIQECKITSTTNYWGSIFYTVSGRIVHGASGGLVLDKNYNVVGLIKGGIVNLSDDPSNMYQGFVPIHIVLEHINEQRIKH